MAEEVSKNCPETCPYLQGWHDFCGLFVRKLETSQDVTWRCEECLNPEQRKNTAKMAELRGDARAVSFRENTVPYSSSKSWFLPLKLTVLDLVSLLPP